MSMQKVKSEFLLFFIIRQKKWVWTSRSATRSTSGRLPPQGRKKEVLNDYHRHTATKVLDLRNEKERREINQLYKQILHITAIWRNLCVII